MLLIVLLLCLGSYQFALFPSECAKCAIVERHVHKEGHNIVAQDDPHVMAELLRWP
jgi:hypothetical protein